MDNPHRRANGAGHRFSSLHLSELVNHRICNHGCFFTELGWSPLPNTDISAPPHPPPAPPPHHLATTGSATGTPTTATATCTTSTSARTPTRWLPVPLLLPLLLLPHSCIQTTMNKRASTPRPPIMYNKNRERDRETERKSEREREGGGERV